MEPLCQVAAVNGIAANLHLYYGYEEFSLLHKIPSFTFFKDILQQFAYEFRSVIEMTVLGIIYIISKNYAKIKMNFKYTHMREYQVVVVIVAASIPKTIFRNAAEMRALWLGKVR